MSLLIHKRLGKAYMVGNILHLKPNSPFQISDSSMELLERGFPICLFLGFYVQIKEELD